MCVCAATAVLSSCSWDGDGGSQTPRGAISLSNRLELRVFMWSHMAVPGNYSVT